MKCSTGCYLWTRRSSSRRELNVGEWRRAKQPVTPNQVLLIAVLVAAALLMGFIVLHDLGFFRCEAF
jgi:hypothetical protein